MQTRMLITDWASNAWAFPMPVPNMKICGGGSRRKSVI